MTYIVSFILAILSYALIHNVVLSRFYGICSFMGVGNKVKNSFFMGLAVTIVIILATLITYPIYHFLLIPAEVPYLDTLVFILVIASLVQLLGMFIKKFMPALYINLGIYLPLITTNCAVLGVVSENAMNNFSFIESLTNAIGTSLGYLAVIVVFACIRVRLEGSNVPKAFKGMPIALIVAGIMAIAFMGLQGIIQ